MVTGTNARNPKHTLDTTVYGDTFKIVLNHTDIHEVRRIIVVSNPIDANDLLNKGWILLSVGIVSDGDQMRETVYQVSEHEYVLGKIRTESEE